MHILQAEVIFLYTFQKENADFVHILSSHKPYAAAYVRGSEKYPDVAGRILFYPAGSGIIKLFVQM